MYSRTFSLLAFVALLVSLAIPLAMSGCTSPSPERDARTAGSSVLTSMGFGLTDDGDPLTTSGTLAATFDAPVIDALVSSAVADLGSAHVAFDDATRDIQSAAILHAYPDNDVAYAVLFEEAAPWRYVVVAAHESALAAGAVIALDGDNAAALVVDEETGSGYLSTSGTLTISAAALVDGGALVGSVDAVLVEVGLDAWPASLFPFSSDGAPSQTAPAAGAGSFDTATGAANVTVDVDTEGWSTFTGTFATQEPADEFTSFIIITGEDGRRALAIYVDNASLVASSTLSLGGYVAGASLFEEDGTQIAFTSGTLTIDVASPIAGTVAIDGDAYVIPAEEWTGEQPPPEEAQEDCAALDSLAATFSPAHVYVEEGLTAGELPEGYDTVLTFADGNDVGMLGVLVETGADYATSFGTVTYEGGQFPSAVMGLATCSAYLEVQGGALDADIVDERMVGTLTFTVEGSSRTIALDVGVVRF